MDKGKLFVTANVGYLDYSKSPLDYTAGDVWVEVKTIHLAKKTVRVVFNNPTKLKRKETSDISMSRISKEDSQDIADYIRQMIMES